MLRADSEVQVCGSAVEPDPELDRSFPSIQHPECLNATKGEGSLQACNRCFTVNVSPPQRTFRGVFVGKEV